MIRLIGMIIMIALMKRNHANPLIKRIIVQTARRRNNVEWIRLFSAIFFLSGISFSLTAQVANNSISNRTELKLDDDWLHSNTANSSVEWRCVNKSLTNKCLVYHNDQWFQIKIRHNKSKESRQYNYAINESGEVVLEEK